MKQSKFMTSLEVMSSALALTSKYLLAVGNIVGWGVGAFGYAIVAIYNFKKDIKILAVVVVGLTLLTLYGWYKWSAGIAGLQPTDYTVIVLTTGFCLWLAHSEWKVQKPLWLLQVVITALTMAAFILIGLGLNQGWYFLGTAHVFLCHVYYKKGAYVYTVLQVISVYIALTKVTSLQLPF